MHPEATFETRDSIYALLIEWQDQPLIFNYWPPSDYDRIPFLQPKSAFNLGRYISETGPLQFPGEWGATGISAQEQRWMQAFFQTGYPRREVLTAQKPFSLGVQRTSLGWLPALHFHGLSAGSSWRLGQLSVLPYTYGGPLFRSQRMRHTWTFQAEKGIQWTYLLKHQTRVSASYVQGRPALGLSMSQTHWNGQTLIYPSGWCSLFMWRFSDGTLFSFTRRSENNRWPSAWLPWSSPSGVRLTLPYRSGHWILAATSEKSQLTYSTRRARWGIYQARERPFLEGQYLLLPTLVVDVRLGMHVAEHGWAIHHQIGLQGLRVDLSLGTIGEDAPTSFSRLRMSCPGYYLRGGLRLDRGRHQGWLRVSLRPNGPSIYGANALQLDQKRG